MKAGLTQFISVFLWGLLAIKKKKNPDTCAVLVDLLTAVVTCGRSTYEIRSQSNQNGEDFWSSFSVKNKKQKQLQRVVF